MTNTSITKSIDNISIEIVSVDGCDYVEITKFPLFGNPQSLRFLKGDKVPICKFLSSLSKLMGKKEMT